MVATDERPGAFKHFFNRDMLLLLASRLQRIDPAFPAVAFVEELAPQLDRLELKERVTLIAAGLRQKLPADYREALQQLVAILGVPIDETQGMFNDGWYLMPVAAFVEYYGLEHPNESLAALHAITQRHTGEFAIRPFLIKYPEQTLATLQVWVGDESLHVRRLVSEGTRTRLPWASRLPQFIADPTPVLALLEQLKDDPSEYVRRSVANNLNDIVKDHPELVLQTLERWQNGASPMRLALIRHALRSLVKQGHPEALRMLGATPAQVIAELLVTPTTVALGGSAQLRAIVRNPTTTPQKLIIDYVLVMASSSGRPRQKVFKLRTGALDANSQIELSKTISFAANTIRRYYAGPHRVGLQVNGTVLAWADLLVVE
jgi:3-methyladenine DNA glycosylase AlkC